MAQEKIEYPEHEKLSGRSEEHTFLQQFCWFLQSNGLLNKIEYYKDDFGDEQMTYRSLDPSKVIAEYFDIDYKEFMSEKDRMLKKIQEEQS